MMMAMMTMMMTDYPGDDYADHKDQHKHQYLQFDLINAKKRDKKGYKNSGQIVVKSVKIEQVRIIKIEQVRKIEPWWWKGTLNQLKSDLKL